MPRFLFLLILPVTLSLLTSNATAIEQQGTSLLWAGCGITKKAFMAELAKAYEKKTGIKVNLKGGGASAPDLEQRLATLKELKDKDLISEEEYNSRRAEILKDI